MQPLRNNVQEAAPSRPLWRAMAAAGLIAQVLVAKYVDHTPFYRQEGIYFRSGVKLHQLNVLEEPEFDQ